MAVRLLVACMAMAVKYPSVLYEKEVGVKNAGVFLEGTVLYQVDHSARVMRVWDVANPVAPRLLGAGRTLGRPLSVVAARGVAYVGLTGSKIDVFDVTQLSSPEYVRQLNAAAVCTGWVNGLSLGGGYLYAAVDACGVMVLEIAKPFAPTYHTRYTYAKEMRASSVSVIETSLHVSDWSFGYFVFDVAHPANPTKLLTNPGWGYAQHVVTPTHVLAPSNEKLTTFSTSSLAEISTLPLSDYYTAAAASGTILWLSTEYGNVTVVDFKNPAEPRILGHLDTALGDVNKGLAARGKVAFLFTETKFIVLGRAARKKSVAKGDLGCFKTSAWRALTKLVYSGNSNTPPACIELCNRKGYAYAGVEYGKECWCGDSVVGSTKTVSSACGMPCSGDVTEQCGGGARMRLFSLRESPTPPTPSEVGCFESVPGNREMTHVYTDEANTIEECSEVCAWNGHKYAGLEYGDECWCGDSLPAKRVVKAKCSIACSGNDMQKCGGGYRMSVYQVDGLVWSPPAHSYMGCFAGGPVKSLPVLAFNDDSCTVEECVAVCSHNGYSLAGLQLGKQCWCGSTISSEQLPEGDCKTMCKGDSSQACGHAHKHSVYMRI